MTARPPHDALAPDLAPDLAPYLEAAAPLLGLPVRPEWREGVAFHLATLLAAAERVAGHPLPDELEAAPVFVPVPAAGAGR
ncbi:DUF4089 domain-containing protein [Methylobacterium sp. JK268]